MTRFAGDPEHIARLTSRPHLLRYYSDLLAWLAGSMTVDGRIALAAFRLALVSEYQYLPAAGVVTRALERGELHEFAEVVFELARAGHAFARDFLAAYEKNDFRVREEAPILIALVRDSLARIPKAEKAIGFIAGGGSGETMRFLIRATAAVAAAAPGSLADILPVLYRQRRTITWPVFQGWLRRGVDLLTSLRVEEGVAFLKLESPESRRLLGFHDVGLRDLKGVLDIYASSLAGRKLSIVSRDVSVFGLDAPFTDGRSVFLPAALDWFPDRPGNERAYSVLTAVQAATVAYGTYGFDLAKIGFRAELAERYGTRLPDVMENVRRQYRGRAGEVREKRTGEVEAVFKGLRKIALLETQLEKFFYSFPTPDLAKTIFTLVETARIEQRLAAVYSGLREDCGVLNEYLWTTRPAVGVKEDNAFEKFRAVMEGLVQISLTGRYRTGSLDSGLVKLLGGITREFKAVYAKSVAVEDSALVCFRIYNLLFDVFPLVAVAKRVDVREFTSGLGKLELSPEIVADGSPELVTFADNRFSHEDLTVDKEAAVDLTAGGKHGRAAGDLKKALADGSVRVFRYPEYDHLKAVMLPGHCTLYERDLAPGDGGYFQSVLARHQGTYKRLKKKLLNLKPEEVEISRKWISGDEIHLQDAVDFSIDLLRGRTPEDKIYVKKIRNRRDVAAAVLLDASSSTEDLVLGARVIDLEKDALCLLGQTLEAIGDDFALYSFASNGRHSVFFNIVKEFADPWNQAARARIGAVTPVASNRDGCAIRHATSRLAALPHKTKLLLLLSDGIPADVDYGSDSNMETTHYAIEDTRQAILEAKRQGIVPYCLTIDREARDYVSRLYGAWHFQVLNDIARLPEKLSKLYLRLTG